MVPVFEKLKQECREEGYKDGYAEGYKEGYTAEKRIVSEKKNQDFWAGKKSELRPNDLPLGSLIV